MGSLFTIRHFLPSLHLKIDERIEANFLLTIFLVAQTWSCIVYLIQNL